MKIQLDFRSGVPIYVQIMDQVREQVERGELKQGDQLPTVRQLATDLRVNFNTVARAYRLLDEAGLISTQHGRGTYIWEQPSPEIIQHLRKKGLDGLTQRYLAQAARQGFDPAEVTRNFEQHIEAWQMGEAPSDDVIEDNLRK